MDLPNKALGPGSPQPGPVPPREKKQAIAQGIKVKRPLTRRFFGYLFSDLPKTAGKQVGREVFLPQVKMALEAALQAYISSMFWGNAGNRPVSNLVKQATFLSNHRPYHTISGGATQVHNQQLVPQKSTGNYEDLIYKDLAKAQAVLAQMLEYLQQYPVVCVADLYEWSDIIPAPSDNAFGWTDLSTARIVPGQGGFILELPRPTIV